MLIPSKMMSLPVGWCHQVTSLLKWYYKRLNRMESDIKETGKTWLNCIIFQWIMSSKITSAQNKIIKRFTCLPFIWFYDESKLIWFSPFKIMSVIFQQMVVVTHSVCFSLSNILLHKIKLLFTIMLDNKSCSSALFPYSWKSWKCKVILIC